MNSRIQFKLKPLSPDAIPSAIAKAMRYRLLSEPAEAESICLDVLETDPQNQEALVILLLAMTDRFSKGYAAGDAQIHDLLARLDQEYDRCYYAGIVCERRAKAVLSLNTPACRFSAFEELVQAMQWYEQAEKNRPKGNEDALLRWNTCARLIMCNNLTPRPEEAYEPALE